MAVNVNRVKTSLSLANAEYENANALNKEFALFSGLKATCNQKFVAEPKKNIKALDRGKPQGLETNPRKVSWNRSSGGSAVNLATHLGAERIVLVGFDMRLIDGVKNWKPHPRERTKPNPFVSKATTKSSPTKTTIQVLLFLFFIFLISI